MDVKTLTELQKNQKVFTDLLCGKKSDIKNYGWKEAVILNKFTFLIQGCVRNFSNCAHGNFWVYNTMKGWVDFFEVFTPKQFRSAIESLKKNGLIITAKLNNNRSNQTLYYCLSPEQFEKRINLKCENVERAKKFVERGAMPITISDTEYKHCKIAQSPDALMGNSQLPFWANGYTIKYSSVSFLFNKKKQKDILGANEQTPVGTKSPPELVSKNGNLIKKEKPTKEKGSVMEQLNKFNELFVEICKMYPGTIRGARSGYEVEKRNFTKKYGQKISLLKDIKAHIIDQKQKRALLQKHNVFAPAWQHFKTYINQESWESDVMSEQAKQAIRAKQKQKPKETTPGYRHSSTYNPNIVGNTYRLKKTNHENN